MPHAGAVKQENSPQRRRGRREDEFGSLSGRVIGAAIAVHRQLGPGLLESAYEECLGFELAWSGIAYERQVPLPLEYRGHRLDCGYRIDLLVEGDVIVELKCVERVLPVHCAQVLSHLRFSKRSVGLLINFHVKLLTDGGIKRLVNGFPA